MPRRQVAVPERAGGGDTARGAAAVAAPRGPRFRGVALYGQGASQTWIKSDHVVVQLSQPVVTVAHISQGVTESRSSAGMLERKTSIKASEVRCITRKADLSLLLSCLLQIYEAGIVHLGDSGAAAAAHGQPLHHVAFAVERNPWSELLEVAGASYVPAAPPAAH